MWIRFSKPRIISCIIAFVVLVALFMYYDESLRVVTTFKNNIELEKIERQGYKEYSALGGRFKFLLPGNWETRNETFGGGEIKYHLYFNSPDSKVHGFVQVWNLKKPLKQFIEESKSAAVGVIDFKSYEVAPIMSDRKNGYLIDYVRANDKGIYYRGYEAFIEGNDRNVYRVSFFVEEKDWKEYYVIIFNRIIQSFKIM